MDGEDILIKLNTIIALIISILFGVFNFNQWFLGYYPNEYQARASIIFTILCFVYGFAEGYKNEEVFIKKFSLFCTISSVFLLAGYFLNLLLIALPFAFIFGSPMHGYMYFLNIPTDMRLSLLCVFIIYGIVLIGFYLGKLFTLSHMRRV